MGFKGSTQHTGTGVELEILESSSILAFVLCYF